MGTHQRLLVVIVNYKAHKLVLNAVQSAITQLRPHEDHIVIVDNDSKDDSVVEIEKTIAEKNWNNSVTLIASDINGGFSYGNNVGVNHFTKDGKLLFDFVLLLNPDTVVKDNAVNNLINFMDNNPKAGITGSRLEGEDGVVQCSSFRFPSVLSELDSSLRFGYVSKLLDKYRVPKPIPNKSEKTDWVAGASMMIKKAVFDDIGLMDEDYFLYFEETDFCLQANRAGWETWYVPQSRVIHFVGQSTGVVSGDTRKRRRPTYWFESRQRYFMKNHGVFYTMLADLAWGIGFLFWRIRRFLQNKPDTDPNKMLIDFWKNSIFFSWLKSGKNN